MPRASILEFLGITSGEFTPYYYYYIPRFLFRNTSYLKGTEVEAVQRQVYVVD